MGTAVFSVKARNGVRRVARGIYEKLLLLTKAVGMAWTHLAKMLGKAARGLGMSQNLERQSKRAYASIAALIAEENQLDALDVTQHLTLNTSPPA